MSGSRFFFYIFYGLFLLVCILTGLELQRTLRSAATLHGELENLETGYAAAQDQIRTVQELTSKIRSDEQELDFLQGLPNLLPKDKSYLRTQKAIADEVQSLRYKVGQRLKNRLHIVIDTRANKLYLKKGLTLLFQADCSVGRGGILADKLTGRRWEFATPRGEFKILNKLKAPAWTKPDWAYVEASTPIPPPNDPSRKVEGELGAYVLNLGDGYLIHGTKYEEFLGTPVSHGCVRLGKDNLEKIYQETPVGTKVYIY